MQMHPYFTEIPLRSFEAMAFEGNLSEVLLALIVDPHEADDIALAIKEVKSSRIEIAFDGEVINAPITLEDFQNLPSKHAFEQLKITLAQWVMTTERADETIEAMTMWNQRFGVWCACAAAREALRFVPKNEERPLRAIETAEAWVRGKATTEQVSAALDASYNAATNAATNAVHAAVAAAYIDGAYDAAARAAAAAFAAAAAAANASNAVWANARDDELIRLLKVVAMACLTFPG